MQAIYPIPNWKLITPSDTEKLKPFAGGEIKRCNAILIGATGDVAIRNEDDTTVILTGLVAGGQYAVSTDQILATGTTATVFAGFQAASYHPLVNQ